MPPQGLPNGLWIVATPIGNLSDISERARRALEKADRLVCEDTRRVAELLRALGIASARPLERFDAHAESGRLERVLGWLEAGENLALLTDAGTPAISDPGAALVRAAHERGIRVTPVPGPSAVTTLLSAAGFGETAFAFHGFFPRKKAERERALAEASESCASSGMRVHLWFESPQRVLEALELVVSCSECAEGRLCVAKELTKVFEKIWVGAPAAILGEVRAHLAKEGERGEWCFALELAPSFARRMGAENSSEWVKALRCLLENEGSAGATNPPISASEAAKRVSQYFGVARREVYEMALRIAGKKT